MENICTSGVVQIILFISNENANEREYYRNNMKKNKIFF